MTSTVQSRVFSPAPSPPRRWGYLFHSLIQVAQYTTGDPRWGGGGQVSRIVGGSVKFSAGMRGLVKKNLDCTSHILILNKNLDIFNEIAMMS